MKRRDFIKTAALSSSLLLIPNMAFSLAKKRNPEIVVIGNNDHRHAIDFCRQNAISGFTSIGWEEKHLNDFSTINNIPFDFSAITVNHTQPLENSVFIPQQVKTIFTPDNKYLLLCSLYRREAVLSREILNFLKRENIDYRFFGAIPFLNPGLTQWTMHLFSNFAGNPKVYIYDSNIYFNKYIRKTVICCLVTLL